MTDSTRSGSGNAKWGFEYPLRMLALGLPLLPLARVAINPALGMLKETAIAVMSLALLRKWVGSRIDSIRITFGMSLTAVLIGYVLLHALVTDGSRAAALETLRFMLPYPLFAIVLFSGLSRYAADPDAIGDRITPLLKLIFASAVLVSLIGMYEKYVSSNFAALYGGRRLHGDYMGLKNLRLVSTMENPISLGLFLQVGLVSAYYLARTASSGKERALAWAGAGLFGYTAIWTLSRASYLIMGVMASWLALKALVTGNLAAKARILFLLAALATAARIFWSWFQASDAGILDLLGNRVFELLDSNVLDSDLRIVMWKMKVMPFLQSTWVELLFGKGIGHIGWGGDAFVMENGYLGILYELGILGLTLFAMVWFKTLYNAMRLAASTDAKGRAYGSALILFMITYLIAMALADVHMNLPLVFYFWTFFGLSEALVAPATSGAAGRVG